MRLPNASKYRPAFLEAIDWGLSVMPKNRPQTVSEWRSRLVQAAGGQPLPKPSISTPARAEETPSGPKSVPKSVPKAAPKSVPKSAPKTVPSQPSIASGASRSEPQRLTTKTGPGTIPRPSGASRAGLVAGSVLVIAGVATLALLQTGAVDRGGVGSLLRSIGSETDGDARQPEAERAVPSTEVTGSAPRGGTEDASRVIEATHETEEQAEAKRLADDAQAQAKRQAEEAEAQAKRQAEETEAQAQAKREADAAEAQAQAKRQAEEAEAKRAEEARAAEEANAQRALETPGGATGGTESSDDKSIVVARHTPEDVPPSVELEPEQRSELVRRIQAELRDKQCYKGAINGELSDGEGAIRALNVALQEDGRSVQAIEIRTASRSSIETWLQWLLQDLNNFQCAPEKAEPPPKPKKPGVKHEQEPAAQRPPRQRRAPPQQRPGGGGGGMDPSTLLKGNR
jgi:hypothetical protein